MEIEFYDDYELKKHTTFKIGGVAKRVYFPKSVNEFVELLKTLKSPLILGGCSNVLISSEGINADVILTSKINGYHIEETVITAECGVKAPFLSRAAQKAALSGFEFMIGFPGTVGGIVHMNASAHNQAVSDSCIECRVFDLDTKEILTLDKKALEFSYRKSVLDKKNYILLDAKFDLKLSDSDSINALMNRNIEFRKSKQPNLALPNAGSVFKNPPNDSAGRLLELAGAKRIKIGGAKVWEGHANFVINVDNATSKDVSNIINKMYNMVKEKYTIELEPEVKYIGPKDNEEGKLWNAMLRK